MATNDFFGIQPVPVQRATQPLQQPQGYDPASVIMQAMTQRVELEKMRPQAVKNFTDSVNTALSLYEQHRKTTLDAKQADAVLELKKAMAPIEAQKDIAQTELYNAQADFYRRRPGGPPDPMDRLLTPDEAGKMGATYGTTRAQAAALNRVPVSQHQRAGIADMEKAFEILGDIEGMIDKIDLADSAAGTLLKGPALTAKSKLPSTVEGQFATAKRNMAVVVRALGQNGVLTEQDEARVMNDFGGFFDTKSSAKARVKRIREIISGAVENRKAAFSGDILKGSTNGPKRIRVKQKGTGKTGTILESDFNAEKYERL